MRNVIFSLLAGFLFVACGDENPTSFYAESSSSEAPLSSSTIKQSSSNDIIESSSSFDAISSSTGISSSTWAPYSYGELIDERDGQVYKTIKIGEQTWMAENLNFAYALPTSKKDSSHTNNKPESRDKYGKLYRWSIAMDSAAVFNLDGKGCGKGVNCGSQPSKGVRGVCPENWHIPNETDIKNIIDYSNKSYDKLIWLEHYWFLTENEDIEFKTEMKLRYEDFWTSAQIDKNNANGLGFVNDVLTTTHSPKGLAYPVRCVKDDEKFHVEHGELKDERDGQVYKTVKIGDQWWMAENLNYAYTDPIIMNYGLPLEDSASFCYNNEPDSCAKYGRLYAWDAAMDCENNIYCFYDPNEDSKSRGICPEKWHIPSVNEWKTLIAYANNFAIDLKSTSGWLDDGNGSDVFGFNLLPAGFFNMLHPENHAYLGQGKKLRTSLESVGRFTYFVTQMPASFDACLGYGCTSSYDAAYVFSISSKDRQVIFEAMEKDYAVSVRCIKDSTESE